MQRLLSISRAAKLVGITRGALQKKIHDRELESFEGQVKLEDIERIFPDVELEDNHLLEDLEKIIESSLKKARGEKLAKLLMPDTHTLTSRLASISKELSNIKKQNTRYQQLLASLAEKLTAAGKNDLKLWLDAEISRIEDPDETLSPLAQKDTVLRVIAAQVHLKPSNHEFFVEGNNNILEAGLSAGLALNYGCSNGNCGKCKAKLLKGEIKKILPHDYVLTEAEKQQNIFLCCSNTAITDIEIEATEAGSEKDIPLQSITAKVKKLDKPTDDVVILNLKTPRTKRLRFLAGQHVFLGVNGFPDFSIPIASCPCDDMNIQFHIDSKTDRESYSYILNDLKSSDSVKIKGPGGDFILNETSLAPVYFIAFDTGFAPVKSLIEHAVTLEHAEYIHLLWLHHSEIPYMHNQCRAWEDALDNFTYQHQQYTDDISASVSQALAQAKPQGQSLQQHDIYVCGSERMVQETEQLLIKQGVEEKRIHKLAL